MVRKTRVVDSRLGGMGRRRLGFGQFVYKVRIDGSSTRVAGVKNFFADSAYNVQVLYPVHSKFARASIECHRESFGCSIGYK